MSTILSTSHMNLAEIQKRRLWDGSRDLLAEMMEEHQLLSIFPWYPSTDGSIHKYVKAKKLGEGDFVDANDGVPSLSSETDVEIMQVASYQGDSEIDKTVLDMCNSKEAKIAARSSQEMLDFNGFTNGWMKKIINGNKSKGFKGFALLRPSITSGRVWNAGQSTANSGTSAYLVEFGEHGVNLRYPGASEAGINRQDMGLIKNSNNVYMYTTHFSVNAGLHVYNEKCLLRMANIATSGSSNLFDIDMALEMRNTLPLRGRHAAWIVNRTVMTQMEAALYAKGNIHYSEREIQNFGRVLYCLGVPVMCEDAITDSEAVVA